VRILIRGRYDYLRHDTLLGTALGKRRPKKASFPSRSGLSIRRERWNNMRVNVVTVYGVDEKGPRFGS